MYRKQNKRKAGRDPGKVKRMSLDKLIASAETRRKPKPSTSNKTDGTQPPVKTKYWQVTR